MRSVRPLAIAAILSLIVGVGTAPAGWNNVFQACCHNCRQNVPSTSFLAPTPAPVVAQACPQPCPPQVSYVQRSYYQPIVSYKTTTYYEPVTTMQTSYYYEPFTAYRSTSFYDPCTGCCKSACTPYTSYRLRSQCNAVQSYVQRNALTPVTNYQQVTYYEQVACQPQCPTPCPAPCPPATPGVAAPAATDGGATLPPISVPPASRESGASPVPTAPPPISAERSLDPMGSSFRKPIGGVPLRPSRVASYTPSGTLQGQLVFRDYVTPRANAVVRFVDARTEREETVKTDAAGRFTIALPAGEWQLHLPGTDGRAVYHSRVEIRNDEKRDVLVVSR